EAGDRLTAPLGLTSARWQILGAIEGEGRPITVAQIGRRMGLSRQSVQRVVNDLERDGFVSFEDNPDHKRAKFVVLTEMCIEKLHKLDGIQARWVNELADGLSDTALRRAAKLMTDIRARSEEIEQRQN
ncbi:MAG: MarR family winged helix-turn-helix transcriptional regulator, partial [Hyphomicrobiaceae bacterium]